MQYVLGIQRFAGHDFCVDGSVLIPRPETEELVQAILDGNARRDGLRVLDIGTGSGAIAVSLALAEPSWSVSAMDVSPQALATARENASRMGAQVEFIMADILSMQDGVPYGRYDVIVSNPPLLFYRAISRFAAGALEPAGRLYFEINAALGDATADLVRSCGFGDVAVWKDISGRDRFVYAVRGRLP